MLMHFKCGGVTRHVTGSFKLDVFKGDYTSMILGGSCTKVDTSCNEMQSSFVFVGRLTLNYFMNLL